MSLIYRDEALRLISKNVRALLRINDMSQQQLAIRSDCDPMQISRLVNMKRLIGVDAVFRVAFVLGVTVDDLLNDQAVSNQRRKK